MPRTSDYFTVGTRMTYLEEGMEYTADGDVVDKRTRLIHELQSTIHQMLDRVAAEEKIRHDNVTVNDAWKRYQTVLTLARQDHVG